MELVKDFAKANNMKIAILKIGAGLAVEIGLKLKDPCFRICGLRYNRILPIGDSMSEPKNKITLNRKQIEFVVRMTEIKEPTEAVKKFAEIMVEERMPPSQMATVIDKIIARMTK